MSKNGLGRKLAVAAAAVGAILLVLRVVGGRDGQGINEETSDDEIDRVDTGRSDEDRTGSPVETGLERVSTADAGSEETEEAEAGTDEEADVDGGTDADADGETGADEETDGTAEGEDGGDEVPVTPTGGRLDGLDLFDYVAIAGAAFEAAREEYRNRT